MAPPVRSRSTRPATTKPTPEGWLRWSISVPTGGFRGHAALLAADRRLLARPEAVLPVRRGREVDAETQRERAAILLDILLTLGPTFIKLGQILSTRPDILPPAYIDVLEGLQDDVPPAPWEESKIVLEDELGPVDETFDDFDREPISGASLGQVYTARYEGSDVAVKVRRPKIESLVEADLRTIRWSIPLVRKFTGSGRAFSLENLADEFAKTIREEMDYNRERAMLEEIRANFADEDRIRSRPPSRQSPARACSRWSISPEPRSATSTRSTTQGTTGTPSPRRSRTCTSR